eukprot:503840-Pyramimonas_sp.AAC.1
MADVEGVLRRMYPKTYVPPSAYKVTKWLSDPFSRGAYTYVPVGAVKADYDRMAMPVTGDPAVDEEDMKSARGMALRPQTRLFFAGEGTIK